jgi:hypothetical protein
LIQSGNRETVNVELYQSYKKKIKSEKNERNENQDKNEQYIKKNEEEEIEKPVEVFIGDVYRNCILM